ncbi:CRISPR-associated endonuclease Cas1 [Methanolobus profundi]|uniref:CRISPR-associated endonuclease Cas1 n=1 Tax=Methanolobus profundi TaxID=487685 RepID=UPI000AEA2A99|nr:CRISPR-associated endonuclease Cas1 [Methanolobus profundi]
MNNLAYDIQEPFRFLVDLSIIDLIELDKMDNKEFIRLRVILSAQTIRNKEG